MTHTPGFEEQGTFVRSEKDIKPLDKYLAAHMPARVRPPGELTAYSNYGASLTGYIVSQVSGMPFDLYVEKHIFKPLETQENIYIMYQIILLSVGRMKMLPTSGNRNVLK